MEALTPVDYHTEHGHKTALFIDEGRKFTQVLMYGDYGLVIRKVANQEQRFMRPLDIPPRKALAGYRRIARKVGRRNLSAPVKKVLGF